MATNGRLRRPVRETEDGVSRAARLQGRRERVWSKALVLVLAGVSAGNVFHAVAGTGPGARTPAGVVPEVSLYAAKEAFDAGDVIFVDARWPWQYEAGHIAGAVNVPLSEFDEVAAVALREVPRDATLVTYCVGVTCNSAERLAQRLVDAGYRRTSVFRHGWTVWQEARYPTRAGKLP